MDLYYLDIYRMSKNHVRSALNFKKFEQSISNGLSNPEKNELIKGQDMNLYSSKECGESCSLWKNFSLAQKTENKKDSDTCQILSSSSVFCKESSICDFHKQSITKLPVPEKYDNNEVIKMYAQNYIEYYMGGDQGDDETAWAEEMEKSFIPTSDHQNKKGKSKKKSHKIPKDTNTCIESTEESKDTSISKDKKFHESNGLVSKKYWAKRYQLFSKFDEGIKLDHESWFSVTPEKIAKHIAERCSSGILIDAFCGAGGNSIHFAETCEKVFAIDIDPEKIALARNNAKVYGVENKIEFILGDYTCLASNMIGDVVFLSPPWGGPSYKNDNVYDMKNILHPFGGKNLFEISRKISEDIAYYLPKNVNTLQLSEIAGRGSKVELEQNFLNNRLIAVTAYYGGLIK